MQKIFPNKNFIENYREIILLSSTTFREKFLQHGVCFLIYDIIKFSKDEKLLEAVEKTLENFIEIGTFVNGKIQSPFFIDATALPNNIYSQLKSEHKVIQKALKEEAKAEEKNKKDEKKIKVENTKRNKMQKDDIKKKSEEVLDILNQKVSVDDFEEDEQALPSIDENYY